MTVVDTGALGRTTTYLRDALGRGNVIREGAPAMLRMGLTTFWSLGVLLALAGARQTIAFASEASARAPLPGDAHHAVCGKGAAQSASVETAPRMPHDGVGNKVYEKDGNGNERRWRYDHRGHVIEAVDAVGRKETNTYDPSGNLLEDVLEAGGTKQVDRTVGYDGYGRPRAGTETIRTAAGMVTLPFETQYLDGEHAQLITDKRGIVTRRELDGFDQVTSERVDEATLRLTTTYRYDGLGHRTAVVDPLGRETGETRDALGRLRALTLPLGVSETFIPDGEGNVISHTDRRGVVHETPVDDLGRVTEERVGGVRKLKREYLDLQLKVVDTDALGRVTTHTQDALGREVRVDFADGTFTTSTYDALNKRTSTDRKGYVTSWDYDGAGRVTAQRDGAVYSQSTLYDDAAGTATHVDRRGITTVTTRDGLGRVEKVARAARTEKTEYDGNGNVSAVVDGNDHRTQYEYDGANRRTKETGAAGTVTTYGYDGAGNRTSTKVDKGVGALDVEVAYDGLNRPVSSKNALGETTTRTFDGGGNKLSETTPLLNTTSWTYDAENRLLTVGVSAVRKDDFGPANDARFVVSETPWPLGGLRESDPATFARRRRCSLAWERRETPCPDSALTGEGEGR